MLSLCTFFIFLQFSLCMVDLDEATVECPDDLPTLPDVERLLLQVSDLVQEYSVNCPDLGGLPSSKVSIRKPSVVAAIKYVCIYCLCKYVYNASHCIRFYSRFGLREVK